MNYLKMIECCVIQIEVLPDYIYLLVPHQGNMQRGDPLQTVQNLIIPFKDGLSKDGELLLYSPLKLIHV